MLKLLIPLVSLAVLAQTPPAPKAPMAQTMPPKPAAEAPEPKDGDAIAYLGTRKITYGHFKDWLKVMVGSRSEMVRKSATSRAQAMKQFLELQVLAAQGQKENLQQTKQFQATLAALKQQCYARVMMDEDRPGSAGQMLKAKAENPTEAEVKAYFDANSERYASPERFTARHLLVSLKGGAGAGDKALTDEEAKARIAKVQEQLKAGKKLEELTMEYSDDPGSKANGGLYKDVPFGRFAKEFEEAVRAQEIGKVGEPVKTTFGYHLILVESRSPKQAGDFEKVKDSIRKQMLPERREKLTREFMEQTRKSVGFREAAEAAPAPKAP